jgi:hypothetical protein
LEAISPRAVCFAVHYPLPGGHRGPRSKAARALQNT